MIEIVATRSPILNYNAPNSIIGGAPPQITLGELTDLAGF